MALRSGIEALRLLSAKGQRFSVVFTSDSRYLVDGMSAWVHDWMKRGWKRKSGSIENLALWQELVEAARAHRVSWRWVRGHRGHPQNEYANMLATRAAAEQSDSHGAVASEFEAWLGAERAKGRMTIEPDPFPDPAHFRVGRALPAASTARLQ
jgi:ribonuclease HI